MTEFITKEGSLEIAKRYLVIVKDPEQYGTLEDLADILRWEISGKDVKTLIDYDYEIPGIETKSGCSCWITIKQKWIENVKS